MKTCGKCGGNDFYENGKGCKQCARNSCKAYYLQNKEMFSEKHKKYVINNIEHLKKYQKEYNIKNKNKAQERGKIYRKLNNEKVMLEKKKWHLNNPFARREHEANRRIRKLSGTGRLSKDIVGKLLVLQKTKCPVCKNKLTKHHLDHIMPLKLGGSNTDNNFQLLCPQCNMQKHAKHPVDFMQEKGYLI